jgi:hypothetical protein
VIICADSADLRMDGKPMVYYFYYFYKALIMADNTGIEDRAETLAHLGTTL